MKCDYKFWYLLQTVVVLDFSNLDSRRSLDSCSICSLHSFNDFVFILSQFRFYKKIIHEKIQLLKNKNNCIHKFGRRALHIAVGQCEQNQREHSMVMFPMYLVLFLRHNFYKNVFSLILYVLSFLFSYDNFMILASNPLS